MCPSNICRVRVTRPSSQSHLKIFQVRVKIMTLSSRVKRTVEQRWTWIWISFLRICIFFDGFGFHNFWLSGFGFCTFVWIFHNVWFNFQITVFNRWKLVWVWFSEAADVIRNCTTYIVLVYFKCSALRMNTSVDDWRVSVCKHNKVCSRFPTQWSKSALIFRPIVPSRLLIWCDFHWPSPFSSLMIATRNSA